MAERTIWLRRNAPAKPMAGTACNGCGTCCTSEPCPLGMLLSLRLRGSCRMLRFDEGAARYRCGLMPVPEVPAPHRGAWLVRGPHRLLRSLARTLVARWIGAGRGCDSTAQAIGLRR